MYSGDGQLRFGSTAVHSRRSASHATTKPPAGGSYDKDANGELTGIAHEAAAMQLLPRYLEWLGEGSHCKRLRRSK